MRPAFPPLQTDQEPSAPTAGGDHEARYALHTGDPVGAGGDARGREPRLARRGRPLAALQALSAVLARRLRRPFAGFVGGLVIGSAIAHAAAPPPPVYCAPAPVYTYYDPYCDRSYDSLDEC